jgi:hypothetical protein
LDLLKQVVLAQEDLHFGLHASFRKLFCNTKMQQVTLLQKHPTPSRSRGNERSQNEGGRKQATQRGVGRLSPHELDFGEDFQYDAPRDPVLIDEIDSHMLTAIYSSSSATIGIPGSYITFKDNSAIN